MQQLCPNMNFSVWPWPFTCDLDLHCLSSQGQGKNSRSKVKQFKWKSIKKQIDKLTQGHTDGRKNRRFNIDYLPASMSVNNKNLTYFESRQHPDDHATDNIQCQLLILILEDQIIITWNGHDVHSQVYDGICSKIRND